MAEVNDNEEEARNRAWEDVPNETRPPVQMTGSTEMEKERKLARAWLRFERSGVFAASDDEDED